MERPNNSFDISSNPIFIYLLTHLLNVYAAHVKQLRAANALRNFEEDFQDATATCY